MNKYPIWFLIGASSVPLTLIVVWAMAEPNLRGLLALAILLSTAVVAILYQQNRQLSDQRQVNKQLQQDVDKLNTVQAFTAALNAAQNMDRLQAATLQTLTNKIGFQTAAMGLVDYEKERLTGWWELQKKDTTPRHHPAPIPIEQSDILKKAWETEAPVYFSKEAHFGISQGVVIPLLWGSEIIAFLICAPAEKNDRNEQLTQIAQLTATRLGTMMTRSRRAQESTIQEERARIAIDLHDTVSQSLFGIVFTLDACLKLLPDKPDLAIPELQKSLDTADAVRQEIRQSIHDLWPRNFTANRFEQDLRRYMTDTLQAVELTMTLDIKGSFNAMSPAVRRSLYRICQESLNNIVHHADATEAKVCLDIVQQRVQLAVRDNGRGFNPNTILNKARDQEQFGLRGMQERILSLGGNCDVFSQPNAGTSLIIDLPLSPSTT